MIPGSANALLLGSAAGGYTISRSLRFNSADSANCTKTAGTPTSSGTWTFSGWIKRATLGADTGIIGGRASGTATQIYFKADNTIRWYENAADFSTTAVFRDASSWYHFVFTKNGSTSCTIYVNGVQLQQNTTGIPSTSPLNASGAELYLGVIPTLPSGVNFYAGHYYADLHFIDGQALDPTSFGEFSATTGVWMPKAFTGTYGTNGFKLDFSDNSAATATTLGKDSSGNGNNWTPNNLSVTAGAGNDSLIDVPVNGTQTDTGAGGEVRGNYATYNPLFKAANSTYSNGNLEHLADTSAGAYESGISTIGVSSGKWYAEFTVAVLGNDAIAGVTTQPYNILNGWPGGYSNSIGYEAVLGRLYKDAAPSQVVSTYTANDVIGVALDLDNGGIWFSKNGTWQGTGSPNPATNTSPAYTSLTGTHFFASGTGGSGRITANFGQRPFAYAAPSGFKALCTANLPAPTITQPSTVMDVVTYTGTGSTLTPTSTLGFEPDLIWIKSRSAATDHALYDSVRGTQARLESNTTDVEVTSDSGVTAFNTAGFTLGTLAQVNTNAATYAAWTWDAGSSTVTNTAGTISSQVRANASAGFSIVTYTGTGVTGTVGHGLGVKPGLIIVKNRDSVLNWIVYHSARGATEYAWFNTTAAFAAASGPWNDTEPTSSVFTVGGANTNNNESTKKIVAYCFAPVAGYSAFGSYTGNGSADGPFVYTGFRPRWLLLRSTSGARDWMIKDALRSTTYNPADGNLYANQTFSEDTTASVYVDILSNGFKLRGTYASINASGETFIYAAFAESPFQISRAR